MSRRYGVVTSDWNAERRMSEGTAEHERFDDGLVGIKRALAHRAEGRVVIFRPIFNEVDKNGQEFFREWRSFDNGPFKEVRWNFGVAASDHQPI